jgi:hypothetical protein
LKLLKIFSKGDGAERVEVTKPTSSVVAQGEAKVAGSGLTRTESTIDQSIVSAMEAAFDGMFQMPIRHVSTLLAKPSRSLNFDVVSKVDFDQDGVRGILCVYANVPAVGPAFERIYQRPILKAEAELLEGMGEICNMIYGSFKSELYGLGYRLPLALPNIRTGAVIDWPSGARVLQFQTAFGEIFVQVQLLGEPQSAQAAA